MSEWLVAGALLSVLFIGGSLTRRLVVRSYARSLERWHPRTTGSRLDRQPNGGSQHAIYMTAVAPCLACGRVVEFNPRLVPNIPIDPVTRKPADLGGDSARARQEPVCQSCLALVNPRRVQLGLQPVRVLPGAHEPAEVNW
jgi:hypothetical protein